MSDFDRDLQALTEIGSVTEGEFTHATPCLRIDMTCPAPMSARPARLDELLVKAHAIMSETITFYGGEGEDFAASKGRKPRASDIAQLTSLSTLMQRSQDADAEETKATIRSLQAQGIEPNLDAQYPPSDSGNLILADKFPVEESGDHIILRGNGAWGIAISFSLASVEAKKAEILNLIEEFLTSGFATTANAGFAFNTSDTSPLSFHETYYVPPTRRFRMLNMSNPAQCRFMHDDLGVVPINSWYWLDKKSAQQNGISHDDIRGLKGKVFELTESPNGFIIKLYAEPILGDLNHGFDQSPAFALGHLLDQAFNEPSSQRGIPMGEQADKVAWLRRFGPDFAPTQTLINSL